MADVRVDSNHIKMLHLLLHMCRYVYIALCVKRFVHVSSMLCKRFERVPVPQSSARGAAPFCRAMSAAHGAGADIVPGSTKRKFRPLFQPLERPKMEIPKARDLRVGPLSQLAVPELIRDKFKLPCHVIVGIEIKTHDFLGRRTKWWKGPHGFHNLTDPETFKEARIVQLGWSVIEEHGCVKTQQRIIRPDGFAIEERAYARHGITNQKAETQGVSFTEAFADFVATLDRIACGYRLVAHHLEFGAGVIHEELRRAGRPELSLQFEGIVKAGVCTMDFNIAVWYRTLVGSEPAEHRIALKLIEMAKQLIPSREDLFSSQQDAGADAEMVALVYNEMLKRAVV